jgi:K+-transporting ATPase A subunit
MGMFDDDDVSGQEIIGLDEIIGEMGAIGEDLDSVLEAIEGDEPEKAASKLNRLAKKMKKLRDIDPDAIAVQNRQPNRRRYWHAPFPATVINTTVTGTLQMQPQELFRTERMFIPSQVAQDFNVTQLFVGQKNQLLVAGEINGSVFSEVAIRSFLNLDTANVGNTVSLSLRNDGLTNVAPRPDLLGTAAV